MPELRLALIVIAVVLVVAVYLFTRWQARRGESGGSYPDIGGSSRHPGSTRPGRGRPKLEGDELPSIRPERPRATGHDRHEPPSETRVQAPPRRSAEQSSPGPDFRRQAEERLAGIRRRLSAGLGSLAGDRAADEPEAAEAVDAPPESAHEDDPAAEALKGFDPGSQKIVSLHVLAVGQDGLDGALLRSQLEDNGCRHGQYDIFHRTERASDGRPSLLFSVANVVEPGQFDYEAMEQTLYRGVTLFAVLPGPWPGVDAFREMLGLARQLAETLGGELRDEARNAFSRQRAGHIEEQITEFERLHRQLGSDRRGS
ncbi:cell division protein ZipA [Natronospira bacteriovora]|uniref:Cell division protein ZipA n=1 Tax=Natronospira bacteriovora TaxID=3069753 RepID=A0ABU0W562_9GAMM|nr:cell division protein ZipA [Natronospira sp. AB-CW4]MDQ2069155.1 cell division protein ZipA [Natronospira sp. AB-CW4]